MIDRNRLAETFKFLVQIDSITREEANICSEINRIVKSLGADTIIDDAGEKIGSNTGNLIAKFKGKIPAPPLMLNAHMDTVEPGRGIKPMFKDGIFTSDGTTILGADDKSAIAILLEAMMVLHEDNIPHAPIELVLTVCEEVGLMGAKHLNYDYITAPYGYTLDASDTEGVVVRAPGANRLEFQVHGKDAHAGAAPETGINAIVLASKAIAALEVGRIDSETTCNIGIIQGGIATNIVPSLVTVKGEVRSHDEEKLSQVTRKIISSFEDTVKTYGGSDENSLPRVDVLLENDFHRTNIPEDHPVVRIARQAASNLDRPMASKITGGGADANIFFQKGIITGVLGTGMLDLHTIRESVKLDDMVRVTELVLEIIKLHSASGGNG